METASLSEMLTPFHRNAQCQIQKEHKSSCSFLFHNVSENDLRNVFGISQCHKAFEDKGFISNPGFFFGMNDVTGI